MRKLLLSCWILGISLVASLGSAGDAEEILVIANRASPSAPLDRDQLRLMFQARKVSWSNGLPARAFNLPEDNPIRHAFDLCVLGLEPNRVARYWIDRQVRGGDRPPPSVPSSLLMVKLISKTAGAVGYIEASALQPSVQVVARIVNGQVLQP